MCTQLTFWHQWTGLVPALLYLELVLCSLSPPLGCVGHRTQLYQELHLLHLKKFPVYLPEIFVNINGFNLLTLIVNFQCLHNSTKISILILKITALLKMLILVHWPYLDLYLPIIAVIAEAHFIVLKMENQPLSTLCCINDTFYKKDLLKRTNVT